MPLQVINLLKDFAGMVNQNIDQLLDIPPPDDYDEAQKNIYMSSRRKEAKTLKKYINMPLLSPAWLASEHSKKIGRLMQISVTPRIHADGFNSRTVSEIALTHVRDAICIVATGSG